MKILRLNYIGIKYKLLFSIGLIFVISFILFITYLIFDQNSKKKNNLNNIIENYIRLISMTNIINLLNLDMDSLDKNFSSFLKQNEIISIEIKNSSNKSVIKKEKTKVEKLILKQMDLIHENDKIGSVEVIFTDYYIKKDINAIMLQMIILGLVVLGIISLFLYYFTNRLITKPIKIISGIAQALSIGNIELKGIDIDLKNKIVLRNDELSETAKAMDGLIEYIKKKGKTVKQMATGDSNVNPETVSETDNFGTAYKNPAGSLNNSIYNIIKASELVNLDLKQTASASQSLSQGTTKQASSLEEITNSITEINSQSKQNSENTLSASGISKKALENSNMKNKQMKKLVNSMSNITKNADEIKKVVKVIDDIAFQINFLDLNANVKAARAGKYGKGFAVVAEEVRSLAGRSAVIEQTLGLEQINQGLGQIDQLRQSNTANAEESTSATEKLAEQALRLKEIVSRFTISDEHNKEKPSQIMNKVKKEFDIPKQFNKIEGNKRKITKNINAKNIIKLNADSFGNF